MRRLYSLILFLVTPLVVARLWWRGRRAPAYRQRGLERFGYVPRIAGRPVWIHAVSVGETLAAAPLIKALLQRHPDLPVLVTTTTPTGAETIKRMLGEDIQHVYFPYDLPHIVRRFLERFVPMIFVVLETELWPNTFASCVSRSIPIVLANDL